MKTVYNKFQDMGAIIINQKEAKSACTAKSYTTLL